MILITFVLPEHKIYWLDYVLSMMLCDWLDVFLSSLSYLDIIICNLKACN